MKTVFFIDDDMRRMQHFHDYLELEGFQVEWVDNDKEALEYLEQNGSSVGLIVLDIIMASKGLFTKEATEGYTRTGVNLCKRIWTVLPKIPIIVLTVVEKNEVRDMMLELGVKAYLVKLQTTPSVLAEKVKLFLK